MCLDDVARVASYSFVVALFFYVYLFFFRFGLIPAASRLLCGCTSSPFSFVVVVVGAGVN